jgi:hypothetical protein
MGNNNTGLPLDGRLIESVIYMISKLEECLKWFIEKQIKKRKISSAELKITRQNLINKICTPHPLLVYN